MLTARSGKRTNRDIDFLRLLVKFVRQRLRDDGEVSVKAIAHHLGYSRQHLSARFRRVTRQVLSVYLRRKRLEKAARLLKSGEDIRVDTLARRCGFHSTNQFRKQFHLKYGMSPRQFRIYTTHRTGRE